MISIKKGISGRFVPHEVRERIVSMLLEKFFDSLGYVEEDVARFLFEITYLVGRVSGSTHIWTKKKYAKFTKRLSKTELKRKVFLRLINVEEDEKEEDSSAKRLGSNTEVFLLLMFRFFYNFL